MLGLKKEDLEHFSEELKKLIDRFGEETISWCLSVLIPGFDAETQLAMEDLPETIQEQGPVGLVRTGLGLAGKLFKWIGLTQTNKGRKALTAARAERAASAGTSSAAPGAAAAAGGLATGGALAAGAAGGAVLDAVSGAEEVEIADITTDKPLNTKSDTLEKLMKDSNKAMALLIKMLQQTQKDLSGRLAAVDLSIDDNTAAQTGQSINQVRSNQSAGVSASKKDSGSKT